MNKIYGNTTATPLFLPNRDAPYIPNECDVTDNAVYSYELCTNTMSTDDLFNFSVDGDGFAVNCRENIFVCNKTVFYNPKTGKTIFCACNEYEVDIDGVYAFYFHMLDGSVRDFESIEELRAKYPYCGVYSGKYKWMSKTNMLGDVNKALDGIIAIQEQLIGGDA